MSLISYSFPEKLSLQHLLLCSRQKRVTLLSSWQGYFWYYQFLFGAGSKWGYRKQLPFVKDDYVNVTSWPKTKFSFRVLKNVAYQDLKSILLSKLEQYSTIDISSMNFYIDIYFIKFIFW